MDEIVKFKAGLVIALVISLLWVLTTAVLAQGEPPSPYAGLKNPFPWDNTSVQEAGKGIYQRSCLGCHGIDGSNIAVADFSTADFSQRLEEGSDLYFWMLSEGRLDKGMPAYKSSLSEEQRWQILTYIWSLGRESASQKVTEPAVTSTTKSGTALECLSCHVRVLDGHDKLGEGSKACWVCHNSTDMKKLHLADGTQLSLSEHPSLCGQCHQKRYEAWKAGTHGTVSAAGRVKCSQCHDPHQPKMEHSTVKKPSPQLVTAPGTTLDCLSCHVRVLKAHDKLGKGSEACWACHYNMKMGVLHLAGGETRLPLSDSSRLCGQCHQGRYEAWNRGTHGTFSVGRMKCIDCHNPHQPQIIFSNITKPHPPPSPSPPPLPVNLVMVVGISLLLMTGLGVVVAKRGEWPWS